MIDRRTFACGAFALLLTAATRRGEVTPLAMTLHRDPGCGCCLAWAAIARRAGYAVRVVNEADMGALKRRLGVPESLYSCHTAVVGGLVIEGHVPMAHIARLRRERPAGIRGIAVPGMPLGSPGMEVPGVSAQRFQVMAFDAAGRTRAFNA